MTVAFQDGGDGVSGCVLEVELAGGWLGDELKKSKVTPGVLA